MTNADRRSVLLMYAIICLFVLLLLVWSGMVH